MTLKNPLPIFQIIFTIEPYNAKKILIIIHYSAISIPSARDLDRHMYSAIIAK